MHARPWRRAASFALIALTAVSTVLRLLGWGRDSVTGWLLIALLILLAVLRRAGWLLLRGTPGAGPRRGEPPGPTSG